MSESKLPYTRESARDVSIASADGTTLATADYRRRWAVVVGVSDYGAIEHSGLRSLKNAAADACAMHRLLVEDFGFESTLLCPPRDVDSCSVRLPELAGLKSSGSGASGEILDVVHEVRRQADPNDLFLFFYAGHGFDEGPGYLLPFNAVVGSPATYLSYNELFGEVRALPCLHRLALFDCCFAGIGHGDDTSSHLGRAFRESILAATDSFQKAMDLYFDDGRGSTHSPFATAVIKVLNDVPTGGSILSDKLYADVHEIVTSVLPPHPDLNRNPEPTASHKGPGQLHISRPGLTVTTDRWVHAWRGRKTHREELTAAGGTPPFTWSVTPIDGVELHQTSLAINPDRLPLGRTVLRIAVRDAASSQAEADLTVVVADDAPLAIATELLPPCRVGEPYGAIVEAEGGHPPLRWRQEGLPSGLRISEYSAPHEPATIRGLVHSADRVVHTVCITAKDADEREVTVRLRLVTIDSREFCEVPAGPMKLGYHPTQTIAEALLTCGLSQQVIEHLARSCPAGEAYIPRFFIKRHPVTRGEWRRYLHMSEHVSTPSWLKDDHDDDLPATDLPRAEIEAYLDWRRTELPSRAQWEKAARGIDGRPFPWGLNFDRNAANHAGLKWGGLTAVDQFSHAASPYGVVDLVGNTWEMVRHYVARRGVWRQHCMGGSRTCYPNQLVTFASNALPGTLEIEPTTGDLVADQNAVYEDVGFREVVVVDDVPPYPQGFVDVSACDLRVEDGRRIRTRRVFLARYAVSHAEYAEFVDATSHNRPRSWRPRGEPFAFELRYLPVSQVEHADAQAFCAWKSEQLGVDVRLPSRNEWMAAVHGPASNGVPGRLYPWGDAFEPLRCNSAEAGFGRLLRVFDLPEGRAPAGAFQLVGNVFEWVGPETVVGGSWSGCCADPASWTQPCTSGRFDVGFRYCTSQHPGPEATE